MIIVTFFQTLGLLLDLDVSWPPRLRYWMGILNVLNINLELARPECSGEPVNHTVYSFAVVASVSITSSLNRCAAVRRYLRRV
jgi:hypothetical protein